MINKNILKIIFPLCKKDFYLDQILNLFDKYKFQNDLEKIHFLTQIYFESGGLTKFKENLNYSSSSRIFEIYHSHFKDQNEASNYVMNEQKLANKVYSNRCGNGDELSGDGFKFLGRGAIQLTFKNTYQLISNDLKIDFINNYKPLEDEYAIESQLWFFQKNNLLYYASQNDLASITKKINGSLFSLSQRKIVFDKINDIINKNKI